MITERQKELACWFGDWQQENEISLGVEDGIDESGQYIGPWLDADWCAYFMSALSDRTRFMFEMRKFGIVVSGHNNHGKYKEKSFRDGSLTEQLQEAVRQAIIWLPKESKLVIEGMK